MIFMRDNRTQKELIKKLPIGTVLKFIHVIILSIIKILISREKLQIFKVKI